MNSGDHHGAVPLGLEDTVDTVLLVWRGREWGHGFCRVQLWTRAPGYKCSGSCKSRILENH